MSHHVYTTEGIVLRAIFSGESSSYIYIFTRELGLVGARAQSVRSIHSKLRYGLQDFSLVTVSLVRGRHEWKITNAIPHENIYTSLAHDDAEKMKLYARALFLLKQLVVGEERNEALFETLFSSFMFLKGTTLTAEELRNVECILILRILHQLGYSPLDVQFSFALKDNEWTKTLVERMGGHRLHAVRAINSSIRESQL